MPVMTKCPACKMRKTVSQTLRNDDGKVVATYMYCRLCQHVWRRRVYKRPR